MGRLANRFSRTGLTSASHRQPTQRDRSRSRPGRSETPDSKPNIAWPFKFTKLKEKRLNVKELSNLISEFSSKCCKTIHPTVLSHANNFMVAFVDYIKPLEHVENRYSLCDCDDIDDEESKETIRRCAKRAEAINTGLQKIIANAEEEMLGHPWREGWSITTQGYLVFTYSLCTVTMTVRGTEKNAIDQVAKQIRRWLEDYRDEIVPALRRLDGERQRLDRQKKAGKGKAAPRAESQMYDIPSDRDRSRNRSRSPAPVPRTGSRWAVRRGHTSTREQSQNPKQPSETQFSFQQEQVRTAGTGSTAPEACRRYVNWPFFIFTIRYSATSLASELGKSSLSTISRNGEKELAQFCAQIKAVGEELDQCVVGERLHDGETQGTFSKYITEGVAMFEAAQELFDAGEQDRSVRYSSTPLQTFIAYLVDSKPNKGRDELVAITNNMSRWVQVTQEELSILLPGEKERWRQRH